MKHPLPFVTFDGDAQASDLAEEARKLLTSYSGLILKEAIAAANNGGPPLKDQVAFILPNGRQGADVVGIVPREMLDSVLCIDHAPKEARGNLEAFLSKTIPPTQVRLVILSPGGMTLMRLDTVPMQVGGVA